MKTKLLKKVRKRFEIIYYPNGFSRTETKASVEIIDHDNSWNHDRIYTGTSQNEVMDTCNDLKRYMLRVLRREYAKKLPKKNKHKGTKLWHI